MATVFLHLKTTCAVWNGATFTVKNYSMKLRRIYGDLNNRKLIP